jgi:hypothetical protein
MPLRIDVNLAAPSRGSRDNMRQSTSVFDPLQRDII